MVAVEFDVIAFSFNKKEVLTYSFKEGLRKARVVSKCIGIIEGEAAHKGNY